MLEVTDTRSALRGDPLCSSGLHHGRNVLGDEHRPMRLPVIFAAPAAGYLLVRQVSRTERTRTERCLVPVTEFLTMIVCVAVRSRFTVRGLVGHQCLRRCRGRCLWSQWWVRSQITMASSPRVNQAQSTFHKTPSTLRIKICIIFT